MTRTIYKYLIDTTHIKMPKGAKVIHVAEVAERFYIWAEVDPFIIEGYEERTFVLYGTGQPIKHGRETHIGTVLQNNGVFVWHVYERHA